MTNNPRLEAEGEAERLQGQVQETVGKGRRKVNKAVKKVGRASKQTVTRNYRLAQMGRSSVPKHEHIEELPQSNQFRQQLRHSLQQETRDSPTITIAKNAQVYNRGDSGGLVYFIESGQVKLLMFSPEDRECLLAIHTTGDIFGELCLTGVGIRRETATAMEETVLRQIPCPKFFARLRRDALFVVGF